MDEALQNERGVSSHKAPVLSVILPVYRQWDQLAEFLRLWEAQKGGGSGAELICVDNEPGSRPADLRLPPEAKLIDCTTPGAYAARNAGAEAASGDWLVFTDADCRPDPDWLTAFSAAIQRNPGGILAGDIRMTLNAAPNRWAKFDLIRGIPQRRYVSRGYAATANLAVPATLFESLGGFDAARLSGGDADFCQRAGRQGHKLRFVEDAVVAHPARASWPELRTKARRVKGGQLTQGRRCRRLYWLGRTCLPPVHEMVFFLRTRHPLRTRLTACAVRLQLWGVELAEALRLLSGRGVPERR